VRGVAVCEALSEGLGLQRATFDSLDGSCPTLKIRLLENLLRSATSTFSRLSVEATAER